ncbi:MAG TPA: glycosyl hydrolase 115 family protein, partial [Pirellulales bacterium]|nr:glycosyl hydrolase 115 family protein [Pirellulales bacterium]
MRWLPAMCLLFGLCGNVLAAGKLLVGHEAEADSLKLTMGGKTADIYVAPEDFKLANIAAGILADDINRVTGHKPQVKNDLNQLGPDAVIIGTIGHSALVDRLIAEKKIDDSDVRGQWETFKLQKISRPMEGIQMALVIFGSDRRGTAYGVFALSEAIGVSPWYWWADVTPEKHTALVINGGEIKEGPPSVKYRGIFINDEDFGIEPWAANTFEPEQHNIGPKTYQKVFELLLRLKGNYLWPAMHNVSKEFGRVPENVKDADDWGIVMGSSHTEAMNRNNVLWPKEGQGPWRYDENRDNMLAYWEQWAKERGPYEAVWTLGIRGVHDSAMEGPSDPEARVKIVEQVFADQQALLQKYVNADLRKVPQMFAPYKEVLSLYQRGMHVPDDVTILWTDDNFGYIRQLSTPQEQQRAGAAGIYYHISYWGNPRSYLWLNTTPPALIWEEMTKAYQYGANRIWVLNVGDIKPGEIGIDFWLRLAWNIHAYDRQSVANYLVDWATREFGHGEAAAIVDVMSKYYRLGFIRKPELIDLNSFNANERHVRLMEYDAILQKTESIQDRLPADCHDAFYELVLYPVKISDLVNHVFLDDSNQARALDQIKAETEYYNRTLAGGKWHYMMTVKGTTNAHISFKWPTNDSRPDKVVEEKDVIAPELSVNAEHFTRNVSRGDSQWLPIAGLGRQADVLTVFPVTTANVTESAKIKTDSPELDYDFTVAKAGQVGVTAYAIPTHRINAQHGLRYAVAVDDEEPRIVDFEHPENSQAWQQNVIRNASITSTSHV